MALLSIPLLVLLDSSSQRVINGVFQTVFFRVVCSEGGPDPQVQKAPKCLKTLVFSGSLCPSEKVYLCEGQESEKHRLENTVWNP